MVGVCDGGGQDRGRSDGLVTTTQAQEGWTRRGEVRAVQEGARREAARAKAGAVQGVPLLGVGPGNQGAGFARSGPRRGIAPSALLQCPPQVRQVKSAVTPTRAATVNQGRAGRRRGVSGGVGGGGEAARLAWAGQCGSWRRIRWRPLASDLLASGLGPALHVPTPVLHFPTTFHFPGSRPLPNQNRQKIPLPSPAHRMTARTWRSCTYPSRWYPRVIGTGSLATTMAVEASVPCGNCPVEADTFARDDDILGPAAGSQTMERRHQRNRPTACHDLSGYVQGRDLSSGFPRCIR
jgi:hypothetical protein